MLNIALHTTAPGEIEYKPSGDHRLKVHAGPPVRGTCRHHRFRYTRGDVDIFPAGMSDVWHEREASTSLVLQLPPSLLRRTADELGLDPDRSGLEPRHQFRDPQIEHIAWALDAERRAGQPSGRLYTDSLGTALAVHLLGRYVSQLAPPRGLSKPQLRRVIEYIDAHLAHDLALAQLAGIAGVSASHLKTLFKRSTGRSVHAYVVERRVARAKALLVSGALPASRIALEVGFAHQSHMARCMRRVLGVTPTLLVRSSRAG